MSEIGPWKHAAESDWWERGRWASTKDQADAEVAEFMERNPNGSIGNVFWEWGEEPRTCSFCGGIHPDDAARLIREGWCVDPTTKSYKRYLEPPKRRQGGLIPPVKVYVQHFSIDQIDVFNAALKTRYSPQADGAST